MKTARRILILLLVVLIALPATIIALLTTSYANSTWQWVSPYLGLPIQAERVHYDFPYHLSLQNVRSQDAQLPYIEQVDVWLNPDIRRDGKWIIDSLLIDGVSLKKGIPTQPNLESIQFHQIALKNIDYAGPRFSVTGLSIQIQDPTWSNAQQLWPYGAIQASAEQMYWHGEAIQKVLVDVDYQAQNSTLYGTSFKWRNSQISGQGEQYPQGWSLVNVTIDKLAITNAQRQSLLSKPWQELPFTINHINSLDLLNADIEWGEWHWQNLELSIEDASLPASLWNATAKVSLQADSVRFQEQTAIEPRLNAIFTPEKIQLQELSLDWQQGRVQVSGQFKPTHWQLDTASVQGLKWAIQSDDNKDWWKAATSALQEVDIQELDIERSQIIQLAHEPFWQLSGLNVEGKALNLKRQHRYWGIWHGSLDASVVNASYDQVLSSHAAISTQSEQGLWQLSRLFAPLEQGYIEGFGQLDLSTASQPWALNLSADGIPLKLLHPYLPDVFAVDGFSDLNLDLQGLSGDNNMLAYSLTGQVEANLRETTLRSQADKSLKSITFSPIRVHAQRGAVSLKPVTISGNVISGQIGGEFDMANNPLSGLTFQLKDHCGIIIGDLLNGEISRNDCDSPQQPDHLTPNVPTNDAPPEESSFHGIAEANLEQPEEELVEEITEELEPATNEVVAEEELATE
ncbi:AsmA family protein [Vibrio parahaemolyticus]|uniref:AsmA family protein n=1 Tax=Vibrio parahaemolyticus TaxID=670 RepID=UPI00081330A7|nr:AsmA family protein [Vibrio parahaemolyticus]OCP87608.1 AsmA family protein [Vibrio parahaemolyticus]OCP95323.1 AsmA family protein [Vibrio parahaemolyticus]